ncbi:hypothetical protein THAOC_35422, partial [Thalassiosira oceanica]
MAPVPDEDRHRAASSSRQEEGPEEQERTELAFWSVVAPRGNASAPGAPREGGSGADARKSSNGEITGHNSAPPDTNKAAAMGNSSSSGSNFREGTPAGLVECVHCHRLTPTTNGPANGSSNPQPVPKTPGPPSAAPGEPLQGTEQSEQSAASEHYCEDRDEARRRLREAKLRRQVLEAAAGTAATLACPMFEYKSVAELFSKASQPTKTAKKTGLPSDRHVRGRGGLASMLRDRPELIFRRAAGMPPVADGFTVLHAAFAAGNLVTVRWLLENCVDFGSALEPEGCDAVGSGEAAGGTQTSDGGYCKLDVDARDQQGRTALHVASQLGQSEVVCYLFEVLDKLAGQVADEETSDSEEEIDEEVEAVRKGVAGLSTSETIVAFDGTKAAEGDASKATSGQVDSSNNDKAAEKRSRSPKRRPAGPGGNKSPRRTSKRSPMRPNNNNGGGRARSPKRSPKKRVSPMRGADAPVDIAGRSPYGAMATSTQGLARTNRRALEGALYSPDDPSVRGDAVPARMRSNGGGGVVLASGGPGSPVLMSPNVVQRANGKVTFEGGRAGPSEDRVISAGPGRKVASRDPLVALYESDSQSTLSDRPRSSLCLRRTAPLVLRTRQAEMRDVPKTDAASARGASRKKDTAAGRSVVPSDPRRSSFPCSTAAAGGGGTLPSFLLLIALRGTEPLALRARYAVLSSSSRLRRTGPLALRARSAGCREGRRSSRSSTGAAGVGLSLLLRPTASPSLAPPVPPGDGAARPPGSLCLRSYERVSRRARVPPSPSSRAAASVPPRPSPSMPPADWAARPPGSLCGRGTRTRTRSGRGGPGRGRGRGRPERGGRARGRPRAPHSPLALHPAAGKGRSRTDSYRDGRASPEGERLGQTEAWRGADDATRSASGPRGRRLAPRALLPPPHHTQCLFLASAPGTSCVGLRDTPQHAACISRRAAASGHAAASHRVCCSRHRRMVDAAAARRVSFETPPHECRVSFFFATAPGGSSVGLRDDAVTVGVVKILLGETVSGVVAIHTPHLRASYVDLNSPIQREDSIDIYTWHLSTTAFANATAHARDATATEDEHDRWPPTPSQQHLATTMFLTHWLELSGVDRLMAPVSDEDRHRAASSSRQEEGPEEQERTELAFWSVVAPRGNASAPGAPREGGSGADARKSSNGEEITDHNSAPPDNNNKVAAMGNSSSSGSNFREATPAGLVECVHCHRLTPTTNGPANGSSNPQPVPKTPGPPSAAPGEPRSEAQSAASEHYCEDRDEARRRLREAKLRRQVLEAAAGTAATLACPMFEYKSVAELFSKASQPTKTAKKTGLPSDRHVRGRGGLAS